MTLVPTDGPLSTATGGPHTEPAASRARTYLMAVFLAFAYAMAGRPSTMAAEQETPGLESSSPGSTVRARADATNAGHSAQQQRERRRNRINRVYATAGGAGKLQSAEPPVLCGGCG